MEDEFLETSQQTKHSKQSGLITNLIRGLFEDHKIGLEKFQILTELALLEKRNHKTCRGLSGRFNNVHLIWSKLADLIMFTTTESIPNLR